jgi:hypothetical protein
MVKEKTESMKRASFMVAILCAVALAAAAAGIDGKWSFESEMGMGKKGGGDGVKVKTTLDLKSQGDKLTGSVATAAGRRDMTSEVTDGKLDGNKFSFVTVMRGRKGEQKIFWSGTVEGDELKGTRAREEGGRGLPFTAKRQ